MWSASSGLEEFSSTTDALLEVGFSERAVGEVRPEEALILLPAPRGQEYAPQTDSSWP